MSLSSDTKDNGWRSDIIREVSGLRGLWINAFQWVTCGDVVLVTHNRISRVPLPVEGKAPPSNGGFTSFDDNAITADVNGEMHVLRLGWTNAKNSADEKLMETLLRPAVPVRCMYDMRLTMANKGSVIEKVIMPALANGWSHASLSALANYIASLR